MHNGLSHQTKSPSFIEICTYAGSQTLSSIKPVSLNDMSKNVYEKSVASVYNKPWKTVPSQVKKQVSKSKFHHAFLPVQPVACTEGPSDGIQESN